MHTTRFLMDPEPIRLPRAPVPDVNPAGFVLCPAAAFPGYGPEQWPVQQWLYERAFAIAQEVVRPSLLERDLLGVWN
jgi:hypothetical protein